MMQSVDNDRKPVDTREWYDFIGLLADMIPGIHMGGKDSTRTLIEMCGIDKNTRILDVGCGGGYTACMIAEEIGAPVVGIDISEVMVSKAQQRADRMGVADIIEFRTADAFQIPFDDNTFDVVLVESVLVPLPGEKGKALQEMLRVLKSGGKLGANESTVRLDAPEHLVETFSKHPATYGTFTPESLRELFEINGLAEIEQKDYWNIDTPSPMKELGCGGLINFVFRVYPKIIMKLIKDARFREASRIDDQITKGGKEFMGYTLVVGMKPK
jgi:ubiquinone/menaquinone biosynthesis C-methylase UbiE